jgi:putative transposase
VWQPTQLTIQQKEERRLAAAQLLQEGCLSQAEIARRLGVSPKAVSNWAQRLAIQGLAGLHSRPKPGRKPHLISAQWQQVLQHLQQGAQAAGFETERWTTRRVQNLIWKHFKVRYNANYLAEQLRALGWSPQKPAVYACERSDELVEAWLKSDWPRIQKKRATWEQP